MFLRRYGQTMFDVLSCLLRILMFSLLTAVFSLESAFSVISSLASVVCVSNLFLHDMFLSLIIIDRKIIQTETALSCMLFYQWLE